jgi:uncharacterized protein
MTPVPSPCTSVCQMDAPTGLCQGCWRTIDEIIEWSRMSDSGKQQVWALIERRKIAIVFQPSPPANP